MTNKILSIIPARGGSKGLPHKNILDFMGKPLIAWTIESSLKSKYIHKTVVSSDDQKILEISNEYGAELIVRPAKLASDSASSESVVKHAIEHLSSLGEKFDSFILLQPTSPLRNNTHIDDSLNAYLSVKCSSLVSVVEAKHHPYKMLLTSNDGGIFPVNDWSDLSSSRQSLQSAVIINGAIYICSISVFLKSQSLFYPNTKIFEMDEVSSVDIDSFSDLKYAEYLMKHVLAKEANKNTRVLE